MCVVKTTSKAKATNTVQTQPKVKKEKFNPFNLPPEVLDEIKTEEVETAENKISVKPKVETKNITPKEKTNEDTVFKHILLKDKHCEYYAVSLENDVTLYKVTKLTENLTNLEIFRKFIVIEYPKKLGVIPSMFNKDYVPFLKNKKLECKSTELTIDNGKNVNAIGFDVHVEGYTLNGIVVGVINYCDKRDPDIKDVVKFNFIKGIKDCKQVNFLNCYLFSRCYYIPIIIEYDREIDNSLTFYDCSFEGTHNNYPILFRNVFGAMYGIKFAGSKITNLNAFFINGYIEYCKIDGTIQGPFNTLILTKSMDFSFIELLISSSTEPLSNGTIEFCDNVNLAHGTFNLEMGSGKYTIYTKPLKIDIEGVGLKEVVIIHINNDEIENHSNFNMDKIILYSITGEPYECEVINLKQDNWEVDCITYVKSIHGWFPIGELINSYGSKSINGVILNTYLKLRNKINKNRKRFIVGNVLDRTN